MIVCNRIHFLQLVKVSDSCRAENGNFWEGADEALGLTGCLSGERRLTTGSLAS